MLTSDWPRAPVPAQKGNWYLNLTLNTKTTKQQLMARIIIAVASLQTPKE